MSISAFEPSDCFSVMCAVKWRLSGATLGVVSPDFTVSFCDCALQLDKITIVNKVAAVPESLFIEKVSLFVCVIERQYSYCQRSGACCGIGSHCSCCLVYSLKIIRKILMRVYNGSAMAAKLVLAALLILLLSPFYSRVIACKQATCCAHHK